MKEPRPMRPLRDLIAVDDALDRIAASVEPVARDERVHPAAAGGRVLVVDVRATQDSPPFDRSRMDGFALASRDLADVPPGATKRFKVVGRSLAGGPLGPALKALTCVEVATGAPLPSGADTVVPVEDLRTLPSKQAVEVTAPVKAGAFVSKRASDYRSGEVLVAAGTVLTPARVAAAASADIAQLTVRGRPRVLIVPTGDEVVPLGRPMVPGQVRESNAPALASFVALRGGEAHRHPIVKDRLQDAVKALKSVSKYDAAVFTGGTSAGTKDFLGSALEQVGDTLFHGVKLRPSKPVLFGKALGRPVLGLPGNPTSCMVGAHLFLDPIMSALHGEPAAAHPTVRVPLAGDVTSYLKASASDFLTLVLVRLEGGGAHPVFKDSMSVMGASQADGYFAVAAGDRPPQPGDEVAVVLWR